EFFRFPKDGPHYRRLVDGFKRLFGASIFFGTEQRPESTSFIDWARFHFFDQMKLWFNTAQSEPASPGPHNNDVTVSEAFYREIDAHRIPVEREVVAALAHASGVLDFYIWLVWKSWTLNGRPTRIPLFGPTGLQSQLGAEDYSLSRYFRRKISSWLRYVKALWPECAARLSEDGSFLILSSPKGASPVRSLGSSASAR
ncbi:MAG TPA: replication protein RepA, partial [Terriglobia bacterium]|nr:replication protein RepA [Terriglobia bacterium]